MKLKLIRKKTRKFISVVSLFLLLIGVQSYSQNIGIKKNGQTLNTLTTGVPFLMIAPDARAGAMGDVGVASTPDPYSLHWNPAKYAFIEKDMGFSLAYSPWLRALVNDINLAYLTGYKRLDKYQTVAASLLFFSLGDITFTDINGETIGQFRPNEFAVDVAYSRKLSENFSGGVALRYIYSNLTGGIYVGGVESQPGQSVATDVSAYYHKEIEVAKQNAVLGVGINFSNIGAKISYTKSIERDFIPMNFRFGPSLKLNMDEYNSLEMSFDINKLLVPTPPEYDTGVIVAGMDPNRGVADAFFSSWYDAPGGFKEEMHEIMYSIGVEYWYDKQFAIRGGYFYEHPTKGNRKYLTVGLGLKYNVFGLDFAYLIPMEQRNPLENTLRFSLTFDFDAFKDQQKEEMKLLDKKKD